MNALLLAAAFCAQYAAAYDPMGVHVDADGVLRSRTTDADPRLAELWKNAKSRQKDGQLLYISLPRLFAEARRIIGEGKPLPDDIRYLGGMTKLQYVFVYPDDKDVVIAGPAEPIDAKVPYRPLGLVSGRPVLHLDDIVVALRAFDGKKPDRIGCDIEITKEIQERISNKIKAVGPTAQVVGFRKVVEQICEAGGPQPVKVYGVDPDTRFAFVCVEADYRLKQLALGVYASPTPKVTSYKSMLTAPEESHRFSLESNMDALRVSPDGRAFELRGSSLKVNGGLLDKPDSKPEDMSTAGKRFVALCNENWDALARHLVAWTDLANLADLAVLAALVHGDKLAEKAGWDLAWLLDAKAWATVKMPATKSAQTQCAYTSVGGRSIVFVTGGVWFKPVESAARRASDEAVAREAARPAEGWSVGRKK